MREAKSISPRDAHALMSSGATLVDIRETEERSSVVPEARHLPLSSLTAGALPGRRDKPVIFYCRSGRRTVMNAQQLRAATSANDIYLLEGGFDAWVAAGLPVQSQS
jgi:rhodanese-related sulfurtransferase